MRKDRLVLSIFSASSVQAPDNIGCINYFPDFRWIIEEPGQFYPVISPGSDSVRIFMVPLLFKIFKSLFSCLKGGSMVDILHVSCKYLPVFKTISDVFRNFEFLFHRYANEILKLKLITFRGSLSQFLCWANNLSVSVYTI